ncbi:CheA2 [Desulforapulum autotrophicum HRM2]|uniref:Chemotaxis protein CheA n=1 Tax=Desulforapulum autotrophicum (strain ATCC 43914 / DSM 3382 / VKM B-1955 / HRM2) TaxID=177437 RepID=C0Q9Z1_DESAH|nr:chemotaxis protein CheW [Desulforapulum autotrophicum]ACN16709.1 CheA2 [Desulforapulum autotrophicum HRM2]
MFEDDETLQMYIEESLEHLSDIESDLLTIEEGGENIDLDIVNNVFRAAHSIKGGAGFMGLTTVKDLAHSLENVLDLIRNMALVPDSERISVLLKGFDRLENLMNNIQSSNDQDVSEHIKALSEIAQPSSEIAQPSSEIAQPSSDKENQDITPVMVDIHLPDGRIFSQVDQSDMEQRRMEGQFIFLVEYDLISDIHNRNKALSKTLDTLIKTGTILESRIDFNAVGTLADDSPFHTIPLQILYASIIEPDMAETLFDLPADNIHIIDDDMLADSSAPILSDPQAMISRQKTAQKKKVVPISNKIENQSVSAPKDQAQTVAAAGESPSKVTGSLRVNVNLLDTLMTLAGELVLSRNQLVQGINSSNAKATELASQRIDMITSELQETIMQTRMQPISSIFTKFTRVVRDLSRQLEKSIDLVIEGKEVELDKTILESINDPLTHLVRNSVDHGIETPDERTACGKPQTGLITLKAFHDAGQVNIVITDDGKGLDPVKIAHAAVTKGLLSEQQVMEMSDKEKTDLILLPGFSTAEQVTDVSGRGVGMDVVVTNLEKLGGIIEIDSTPGKGTVIQIKLPLTLAIIPSQIISVGKEKYAVPQVNLDELLRIPAAKVKERIEKVGDADVVRLRGNLLPLLDLAKVLGIEKTFVDPQDKTERPDRRNTISDRRGTRLNESGLPMAKDTPSPPLDRQGVDRRFHAASAINIAVVSAGSYKYGLVVDELKDSEEIVVKPLGRHMKRCAGYAGATIMGDGRVALILDVSNLAQMAELTTMAETERVAKAAREARAAQNMAQDKASLLLFRNAETEYFAAPLNLVERIERIASSAIEHVGGKKVIQYRGGALPLYELSQVTQVGSLPQRDQQEVIVFKVKDREIGLMVCPPVDALEVFLDIDDSTLKQKCINGSMIIDGHTTLLVDIFGIVKELNPGWFVEEQTAADEMTKGGQKVILFAEDSAFFRNQVRGFMNEEGYKVITAEDGAIAWDLLNKHKDEIDIIVTDLEMPNMDGFELTERIKNHPEFSHYTVIALTSLASDAHIAKGEKVGIDTYEIKLDRENLMKVIRNYLTL